MTAKVEKDNIKGSSYSAEVAAIALFAVATLIFLSLFSYNESDPSIITASSQKTKNWIGTVGANTAAVIFSIIGNVAYALPFLIALYAWQVFQSKTILPTKAKLFGLFIFVLSAPTLLSVFDGYGAIVGTLLGEILTNLLGKVGSSILLFTCVIISLLLITETSFDVFFDTVRNVFGSIISVFRRISERYKRWNEEQKRKAKERLEKRNKARLEGKKSASPHEDIPQKQEISQDPASTTEPSEAHSPIIFSGSEMDVQEEDEKFSHEREAETNEIDEKIESHEADKSPRTASGLENTVGSKEIKESKEVREKEASVWQKESTTGELKTRQRSTESTKKVEQEDIQDKKIKQSFDDYILPSTEYLTPPPPHFEQREEELLETARMIVEKTKEFNVTGRVVHICQGPVVTTYEFKPDPGVKYSRIVSLADDLCLALKAESIRIDRIPGKAYVGIEVPNKKREVIYLREIIESRKFRESESLLTIALGKTIDGANYITDLAKMPHLLIAGATGSGKSVGVNALIVSILYKARPDQVKFIMVDPKRLELGVYADIPHLATPIITDPKRASIALRWAVAEMERRYKHLAGWGVRNIDGYNEEVKRRNEEGDFNENGEPWKPLPYIVIIIDEFADLMMVSGNEVEEAVTRLAQMARAVGIHLVLATQRPSVDVITGLIKANFPARISFRVSSKVDSRTVIDMNGAEKLLGKGDMLFLPPATSQIIRVHGAFVEEKEIFKIVEHIKAQGEPEYDATITKTEEELEEQEDLPGKNDPLFWDALRIVVNAKKASTSLLQRHLRIGYGRAAAILDAMVRAGYVGEMDASARARPVLPSAFQALEERD